MNRNLFLAITPANCSEPRGGFFVRLRSGVPRLWFVGRDEAINHVAHMWIHSERDRLLPDLQDIV